MTKQYYVICFNNEDDIYEYKTNSNFDDYYELYMCMCYGVDNGSFALTFNTIEERSAFMKGLSLKNDISECAQFVFGSRDVDGDETKENLLEKDVDNLWFQFCEKHYPDFKNSNLAKTESEYYRFLEGGASKEIEEKIEKEKFRNINEVVDELVDLDVQLFRTAIREYYKKRYKLL